MQIHFRALHAYTGCGVRITGLASIGSSTPASVIFDDDSSATAQCSVITEEQVKVWVDAYTTQAGNVVKPRAWVVERQADAKIWKITARIGSTLE